MRAVVALVVLCLVCASRPAPEPTRDDPRDAQLDAAKSRIERTARRDLEPRERIGRGPVLVAIATTPFVLTPPAHARIDQVARAVEHPSVTAARSRSARGPPVG